MVMRVFVAGGTGVLGRRLVPQLVARGHQVTATTTSAAKLGLLAQLGADGVVMDGLDAVSAGEAVAKSQPDAIVHQMTAISVAHAGKPDFRHFDRWFATTSRLRTEGTDHLLSAAEAAGVSHFVAQGYASWNGIRQGGWVKTEEDPLDLMTGTAAHAGMEAIGHVEGVIVKAGGTVLRYGWFTDPGIAELVRAEFAHGRARMADWLRARHPGWSPSRLRGAAAAMIAAIDGLFLHALLDPPSLSLTSTRSSGPQARRSARKKD